MALIMKGDNTTIIITIIIHVIKANNKELWMQEN